MKYDKNFFREDRWYHVYLYLMTVTNVLSLIIAYMTVWNAMPIIMTFGIMMIVSIICFFTESAVMGFTAYAGGFFWTAVTCWLVVHYLPFPVQ